MYKNYLIAWFGLMILAIINGTIRDFTYQALVGGKIAHQISTVTLVLFFAFYVYILTKKLPLKNSRQAVIIGIIWFIFTEIFEFGLGLKNGLSWEEMLNAYNLLEGELWVLIPLWVLISPYVFYKWHQGKINE